MKVEISDSLVEEYKRVIVKGGYDAPETDEEWTNEIEEIIQHRIDCGFSGIDD